MPDTPALSPQEARRLSTFLQSQQCPTGTLSMTSLKGFLFAIASGPAWVAQDEWLPLVFVSQKPNYRDEAQRQFVLDAITRLYHQIQEEVDEGRPKMPGNCRLKQPWPSNFAEDAPLRQWCEGFLQGHMGLIDWWEDYLAGDEELQEALGMAVIILGFYADQEESESLSRLAFGDDPVFSELAEGMRSYMPGALRSYVDIGLQLYQEHSLDQEMRQLRRDLRDYQNAGDNIVAFPLAGEQRDPRWQAQQIMFNAWESNDRDQRIYLANEALAIDPDCVDAFLMLATDVAKSRQEVLGYLRDAVSAGERSLGEAMRQDAGHFWSLPETRPYMRARYSLAETLWELGKREESITHLADLLHLNPEDNQGVRYMLISHYIEMGLYVQARDLWQRFRDDDTAVWLFARALLTYLDDGPGRTARQLLRKAIRANPLTVEYLLGQKHLPKQLPAFFGIGDENEAVVYAWYNRKLWRVIPGALDWLLAVVTEDRPPAGSTGESK